MRYRFLFLCFCLHLSITTTTAQIAAIKKLQEAEKVGLNLHFYPSTLRMINIQQDTAYNNLIKEIKKLSFYQLDMDSVNIAALYDLVEAVEKSDGYELYMDMSGAGRFAQVLGNEAGTDWMAITDVEGQAYIVTVKGAVNWLELPNVFAALSAKEEEDQSGFGILFDYLQEDTQNRKNRKQRRKEREEKKRQEELEETAKEKQDSTTTATPEIKEL